MHMSSYDTYQSQLQYGLNQKWKMKTMKRNPFSYTKKKPASLGSWMEHDDFDSDSERSDFKLIFFIFFPSWKNKFLSLPPVPWNQIEMA